MEQQVAFGNTIYINIMPSSCFDAYNIIARVPFLEIVFGFFMNGPKNGRTRVNGDGVLCHLHVINAAHCVRAKEKWPNYCIFKS